MDMLRHATIHFLKLKTPIRQSYKKKKIIRQTIQMKLSVCIAKRISNCRVHIRSLIVNESNSFFTWRSCLLRAGTVHEEHHQCPEEEK